MNISEIPEAIANDLRNYTEEKCTEIDKAVRKHTQEALDDVIANSPVRTKNIPKSGVILINGEAKPNYQPGAYKKGWIRYISTARPGRTQGYVRNKTNYQIAHLLEKGHKSRNGGWVKPSPRSGHIIPAETKARQALQDDIDKILSKE